MKILMLSLLIALSSLTGSAKVKPDSVWLCMGKYSKVYHASANCRGLRNCKGKLVKVSLEDAINKYSRRPCGFAKNNGADAP